MACVNCGCRSDSDLCDRCSEEMYQQEYLRQAEQEAYEAWCAEREQEARNLGII